MSTPETVPPLPPAALLPPGGHLLCIDDNPVNGLLLQEFFHLSHALPVRLACSGADGLAQLRADRPLALLLDLVLPDMSGLAVLEQLRADPTTATLPVAIVSGSVNADELAQARRLGAQAHWPKPLDLSRLSGQLADLLARGG